MLRLETFGMALVHLCNHLHAKRISLVIYETLFVKHSFLAIFF